MRLELTRSCDHYPLKVACIPISPPALAFGIERLLCPEQDSNLHASRHTHLKRTRLPIPPPGRVATRLRRGLLFAQQKCRRGCSFSKNHCLHNDFSRVTKNTFNELCSFRKSKQNICSAHFFRRAANETRTRDPDLGKVVLYQLSYCRIAFGKSCYRTLLRNIKRTIAFAFPTTTLRLCRGPHFWSFFKEHNSFRKSGCKSTTNF